LPTRFTDLGLLLMRIVVAIIFGSSGWTVSAIRHRGLRAPFRGG
jgi:uncharacterized membrane protein YphA (DoxX/SURF4 family)